MLDQGISVRSALVWIIWLASGAVGIAGWLEGIEALGRLGLVLAAMACTLMVLNDNARTREMVNVAMLARSGDPVRSIR